MVISFVYLRNLNSELAMRAAQLLRSALQGPQRPTVLLRVEVKDRLTSAGLVHSSPPPPCAPVTAPVTNTGIALEAHSLCKRQGKQVWAAGSRCGREHRYNVTHRRTGKNSETPACFHSPPPTPDNAGVRPLPPRQETGRGLVRGM